MNKKLNTFLFLAGATVFNITVTVLAFLLLIFLYATFLSGIVPEAAQEFAIVPIFIGAIAVAFFAYRLVINKLLQKIKFEDYFDPIVKPRRPPPKKKSD